MLSKNQIKNIRALSLKKERDEQGLFVAEGEKLVSDLLPFFTCRSLFVTRDWVSANPNIESVESEMIIDKVNGNHWNADENQYLTNSISTQSLIIEAFKTSKIETKSLVQWILHRYKQNTWQSTLSSNYALHSIISNSDFNKNTNKTNCTFIV